MTAEPESPQYRGVDLDERFIAAVLERLDEWTRQHSRASAEWAERTARELALEDEDIRVLRIAALLHAVDRLGVPRQEYDICRLTEAEEASLRRAPIILGRLVPEEQLGRVVDAVVASREYFDGSGRQGLKGDSIPLLARIVAVACAFQALTMRRPGASPLARGVACARLAESADVLYDARVVEALTGAVRRFEREHGGGRCDS